MGNTPSMQQGSTSGHTARDGNHRFKRLQELEKGRQQSITSQLFPSRNTRHSPLHDTRHVQAKASRAKNEPPLFKADYSLDNEIKTAKSTSTESIKDTMAGLSLRASNENGSTTPSFLRPGPSASTVQPTREEALSVGDTSSHLVSGDTTEGDTRGFAKYHRPSVVALMKSLNEDPETSGISSEAETRSPSIDIYGALDLKSKMNADKSTESDSIFDDGYLQSEDVVLNQSLLHNALKKDMKRKRPMDNKSNTLSRKNNISTNTSHEARLKVISNSLSYESFDNGMLPDLKKLKSLSTEEVQLPSFQPATSRGGKPEKESSPAYLPPHLSDINFDRIDSFERQSIEHREGLQSPSFSPSYSSDSTNESEMVHVILKFRDDIGASSSHKVAIFSPDIISALNYGRSDVSIPMQYNESNRDWYIPDLNLPQGIYKLQFLVDGIIRHSNFLPTATDSVGNIVNWFEVIPGYETVEPYREQIDVTPEISDTVEKVKPKDNATTGAQHTSQGTLIAQPTPGKVDRPTLATRHTSSYHSKHDRAGTPYSDYTGISRTSSAVRKSPSGPQTVSSIDLLTALQPKKYEYSSEIPEIFKAGNASAGDDENQPLSLPSKPPPYDQAVLPNNVVDCNQDSLFAKLQQGGMLDAETAEIIFLEKHTVPDLPIYLNSTFLNSIFNEFQHTHNGSAKGINHIIPHVNLNHLLTSSIRDEMISVGCTTRYEGKFITQVIYAPCYYANHSTEQQNS